MYDLYFCSDLRYNIMYAYGESQLNAVKQK